MNNKRFGFALGHLIKSIKIKSLLKLKRRINMIAEMVDWKIEREVGMVAEAEADGEEEVDMVEEVDGEVEVIEILLAISHQTCMA